MFSLTMNTIAVSLNARQAKPGMHSVDTTRVCFTVNEHTSGFSCFFHTCLFIMQWDSISITLNTYSVHPQDFTSLARQQDSISVTLNTYLAPIRFHLLRKTGGFYLHHTKYLPRAPTRFHLLRKTMGPISITLNTYLVHPQDFVSFARQWGLSPSY